MLPLKEDLIFATKSIDTCLSKTPQDTTPIRIKLNRSCLSIAFQCFVFNSICKLATCYQRQFLNIFQPMISQQIYPNQVLSTKFSQPILVQPNFLKNRTKQFPNTIFSTNISQQFLNIFSTNVSQQMFLNNISQYFLNNFSQHFLNMFSTKCFSTKCSQQKCLNSFSTFSPTKLSVFCHTNGLAEWGKLKEEEKRN